MMKRYGQVRYLFHRVPEHGVMSSKMLRKMTDPVRQKPPTSPASAVMYGGEVYCSPLFANESRSSWPIRMHPSPEKGVTSAFAIAMCP